MSESSNVYTSMRNVIIRISATNHINVANEELGVKAGDEITYTKEDILEILEKWSTNKIFKFYLIEHDEDPNNKHFHIVLRFKSATPFGQIKAKFPYGDIEKCNYGVKNAVQYLVHMNHPEKAQYEWEDVETNDTAGLEKYKTSNGSALNELIAKILSGEIKEFETDKIDTKLYFNNYTRIKRAFEYRRKLLMNLPERDIQVICLQGPPRVGKSTFCKVYAKKHNKSICFSSSSNDPLQDYGGQDILVYDDFNYEKINIEDFLKALDPHNNTSTKSRYNNKLFIGDTIFICSNVSILEWFTLAEDVHRNALFKRINCVMVFEDIDENGITEYTINKIVPDDGYESILDRNCRVVHSYKRMALVRTEEKKRKFDLSKYVDLNSDTNKTAKFLQDLDEI
jgi:hypothetical protein